MLLMKRYVRRSSSKCREGSQLGFGGSNFNSDSRDVVTFFDFRPDNLTPNTCLDFVGGNIASHSRTSCTVELQIRSQPLSSKLVQTHTD